MESTFKGADQGKFAWTAGKFYGDADKDKGNSCLSLDLTCLYVPWGKKSTIGLNFIKCLLINHFALWFLLICPNALKV